MKQKIFFRADAGTRIGYGHFTRSLALAGMLNDNFDCTFFTQSPTEYQRNEVANVCDLVALPSDSSKFSLFLEKLVGNEIVVLDNYFFDSEYQNLIRAKGCKLVCIDDVPSGERTFTCDVIINPAPWVSKGSYSNLIESYSKVYCGLKYLLLRKEFFSATRSFAPYVNNKNVFICFGGSDESNLSLKCCKVIAEDTDLHVNLVIGDGYVYKDILYKFSKDKNISVFTNLDACKIVSLIRSSKFAIVPASTIFFEVCCLRRPIISGYDVDNQMKNSIFNIKSGLCCDIGNLNYNFEDKLRIAVRNLLVDISSSKYAENQEKSVNDSSKCLLDIFKKI